MRAYLPVLTVLMLTACARQVPAPELASAPIKACAPERIPEYVDQDWREVKGDGFTYCVPAAWQSIGARAQRWTSPAADLEWGVDDGFRRHSPFVSASRGQTGARFGSRVVTETIDGATVRLDIQDLNDGSLWRAAASWLEPSLRLYASARSATASREVMGVYRSIRFTRTAARSSDPPSTP